MSQSVLDAMANSQISYHSRQLAVRVNMEASQLTFGTKPELPYDLLAYVPPDRASKLLVDAGLARTDGWIMVHRHTRETATPNVVPTGTLQPFSFRESATQRWRVRLSSRRGRRDYGPKTHWTGIHQRLQQHRRVFY